MKFNLKEIFSRKKKEEKNKNDEVILDTDSLFNEIKQQPQNPSTINQNINAAEQPNIQQPNIQQPNIQQPNVQQPNVQQPNVQQPNVQQPNVQQPNVQQPNVQQPNVQQPNVQQPNVQTQQLDINLPQSPDNIQTQNTESFQQLEQSQIQNENPFLQQTQQQSEIQTFQSNTTNNISEIDIQTPEYIEPKIEMNPISNEDENPFLQQTEPQNPPKSNLDNLDENHHTITLNEDELKDLFNREEEFKLDKNPFLEENEEEKTIENQNSIKDEYIEQTAITNETPLQEDISIQPKDNPFLQDENINIQPTIELDNNLNQTIENETLIDKKENLETNTQLEPESETKQTTSKNKKEPLTADEFFDSLSLESLLKTATPLETETKSTKEETLKTNIDNNKTDDIIDNEDIQNIKLEDSPKETTNENKKEELIQDIEDNSTKEKLLEEITQIENFSKTNFAYEIPKNTKIYEGLFDLKKQDTIFYLLYSIEKNSSLIPEIVQDFIDKIFEISNYELEDSFKENENDFSLFIHNVNLILAKHHLGYMQFKFDNLEEYFEIHITNYFLKENKIIIQKLYETILNKILSLIFDKTINIFIKDNNIKISQNKLIIKFYPKDI